MLTRLIISFFVLLCSQALKDLGGRSCEKKSFSKRCLQTENKTCYFSEIPIKPDYVPENTIIELKNADVQSKSFQEVKSAIFSMRELSHSLINIDFTLIDLSNFNYGTDWGIHFRYGEDQEMDIPQTFIKLTKKNSVLKFFLFSYETINLKLSICLYNPLFASRIPQFLNTTSVETFYPRRQGPFGSKETYQFFIVVPNSGEVELPLNLPSSSAVTSNPPFILNFVGSSAENTLMKNELIEDVNSFNPNSKFWGLDSMLKINYLPFLSNCEGFSGFMPLSSLIEQSRGCELVSEEETQAVSPFGFGGGIPKADICTNIEVKCILDEDLSNDQKNYWFRLPADTTLFQITKKAMKYPDFIQKSFFAESEVVNINVENIPSLDKIPKTVNFGLKYYQVSKTEKKLISGSIGFSNYIKPSDEEVSGTMPFKYTLVFSYIPMTHTELVISFAFSWQIYFFMYLGIFSSTLIIVVIIYLYHALFYRKSTFLNFKRPQMKFLSYLRFTIPPIKGIIMALIPTGAFLILVSFLMQGAFMGTQILPVQGDCEISENISLSSSYCLIGLFDSLVSSSTSQEFDLKLIRFGRIGVSFLVGGLYLNYLSSYLLIADSKEKESYSGNTLEIKFWKISQFTFCTIVIVLIDLYIIYFSYSSYFGENIWMMLAFIKIILLVIEYILEKFLKEILLVSPLSSNLGMILNFATFGADNFLEFLIGYLIGTAITIMERLYLGIVVEKLISYIEKMITKTYNGIIKSGNLDFKKKKLVSPKENKDEKNNNEETENEDSRGPAKNQGNTKNKKEDDDSDIIFTEEDEDENSFCLSESDESKNNTPGDDQSFLSDSGEEVSFDDGERVFKLRQEKYENALKASLNYNKKSEIIENEDFKATKEELHNFLAAHNTIAGDTITLFFFPIMIWIIWIFYDETNIADNYNIKKEGYIYYFLFVVVQIPFQMITDVFYYNTLENYLNIDFIYFLTYFRKKFKERKTVWVNDADVVEDLKIEHSEKTLSKFCFSSQMYFVDTLHLLGQILMLLSIQIFLSANYNPFADTIFALVALFWLIVIVFIHYLSVLIGNKLGIWHLKKQKEETKDTENNLMSEYEEEEKMSNFTNFTRKKKMSKVYSTQTSIVSNLKAKRKRYQSLFIIPDFERVYLIKQKEERYKEICAEFLGDKYDNDEFKRYFLLKNRRWLKENLKLLFTPSTLKRKRPEIIHSFSGIAGVIDLKKEDDEFDIVKKSDSEEEMDNKKDEKNNTANYKVTKLMIILLEVWLKRVQLVRKLRSYIGGVLEEITLHFCEFCGRNWGVRTECMENIEDLFKEYLAENTAQAKIGIGNIDVNEWQKFYKAQAHFRTICFSCSKEIHDNIELNKEKLKILQRNLVPEIRIYDPSMNCINVPSLKQISLSATRRSSSHDEFDSKSSLPMWSELGSPREKISKYEPRILDNIEKIFFVWRGFIKRNKKD